MSLVYIGVPRYSASAVEIQGCPQGTHCSPCPVPHGSRCVKAIPTLDEFPRVLIPSPDSGKEYGGEYEEWEGGLGEEGEKEGGGGREGEDCAEVLEISFF